MDINSSNPEHIGVVAVLLLVAVYLCAYELCAVYVEQARVLLSDILLWRVLDSVGAMVKKDDSCLTFSDGSFSYFFGCNSLKILLKVESSRDFGDLLIVVENEHIG
ncbi:hypothetical protein C5167_050128 [Papaver somniferum]|uniref:Uncharacterized protein n=1 Tax=Papaver somniferum TaxID=3469 RepID=A0A4Y7KQN4_PAPSO|nr:hypothetical protein C5167_050128 [Papaver somniferum]